MAFDKGKYDAEYNRTQVKCKRIPFNKNNPDDMELLEWLEKHDNVTQYVKQLIREDMRKTVNTIIVDIENMQPGYRNKEALNTAVKEEHRVLTKIVNNLQVMVDVDTKTILRVDYWC